MRKNIIRRCFTILMFLLLGCRAANAQQTGETQLVNPNTLLATADTEIFKRASFKQDFSEDQGYVNELPNPVTVHQYYIYDGEGSDMLMTMKPSEVVVHTTNKRLRFDLWRNREFHATYSVVRRENIPDGEGGICWMRYSNEMVWGKGRESGVMFYPGGKAYYFTPVDGEMVYTEIADLSDIDPDKTAKFDFIRLDGVLYVYVDGKFRFSYEDGIKEPVSFEGGAELFTDGNRVRCCFDDFSMKTK